MAVDMKVYCDKCGDRITQDRSVIKATTGPLRQRDPIDLCDSCRVAFVTWLGPIPGRKGETPQAAARARIATAADLPLTGGPPKRRFTPVAK
jgi:hypothetical protein